MPRQCLQLPLRSHETLALDIAVREYGHSRVVVVLS
jgi:hypothetical protein